jgi:ribosomal-protein-alanine N-acetyltransferase
MSKEIGIELATVVDAAHVAAMSRDLIELGLGWSWTPSRVARHIRSSDSVVLVAKDKKRIAAFAIMRFGQEEAHLDLLAVRPKYRRSSMGRRLIAWLENSALVAGISVVYLEVRADNREAQAFYERLGYCRIRQIPGYYSGRISAICMARDLWCPTVSNAT